MVINRQDYDNRTINPYDVITKQKDPESLIDSNYIKFDPKKKSFIEDEDDVDGIDSKDSSLMKEYQKGKWLSEIVIGTETDLISFAA